MRGLSGAKSPAKALLGVLLSFAMMLTGISLPSMTAKAVNATYDVRYALADGADVNNAMITVDFYEDNAATTPVANNSHAEVKIGSQAGTRDHHVDGTIPGGTVVKIMIQTAGQEVDYALSMVDIGGYHPTDAEWAQMLGQGAVFQINPAADNIVIDVTIFNPNAGQGGGGQGGDPNYQFDGNAYFCWGMEGKLCYHKFTNIEGSVITPDRLYYPINFFKMSDLTDQSPNGLDYKADEINTYPDSENRLENWVLAVDLEDPATGTVPEDVELGYVFGDGDHDMGCQLNPTGAVSGNNSIASNGDRNFRAVIYNDSYQSVAFSEDPADYTYFPGTWDSLFYSMTFDISDTTPEEPVEIETYPIEPSFTMAAGPHSKSTFVSVKALDVNPAAVTVKDNTDGSFTFTFNSNYYDSVTFEITMKDGSVGYIRVNRKAIDIKWSIAYFKDPGSPEETYQLRAKPEVYLDLLYPADKYTYKDFQVLAEISYLDGTSETKLIDAGKYVVDAGEALNVGEEILEDGYTYVWNDQNLKHGKYVLAAGADTLSRIENIYATVIIKGALNSEDYGGTFLGSGRGVLAGLDREGNPRTIADIFEGEMRFWSEQPAHSGDPEAASFKGGKVVTQNLKGKTEITVRGTVENGVLAVTNMVYDETGKNLILMQSTGVNADNTFEDVIQIPYGSYVIKSADYKGGPVVSSAKSAGDNTALIAAFVERMYEKALGRASDPDGLADWVARLQDFRADGASLGYGFVMSKEFENRKLSNEDYVKTLYAAFFDREPDEGGFKTWTEALANGDSRSKVLAGFINSKEFANLCARYGIEQGIMYDDGSSRNPLYRAYVESLYLSALDRDGEEEGVNYWLNELESGNKSLEVVAKSFFLSQEFVNRDFSNEDFVELLYGFFLGRPSDEAGKADWVGRLENGTTREEVLEGFSRSAEFAALLKDFGL